MDIYVAIVVLAVVSALLVWAGWWCGRHAPRWGAFLLMASTVVACVLFMLFLQDTPLLARVLSFSGVVILGQWTVPLSSFGAGLVASAGRTTPWVRAIIAAGLITAACYNSFIRYVGEPPPTRDRWIAGVCLQSRPGNCGAAAAATLAHAHGIRTSEEAMVRDCLTRTTGTTYLGLYRGLTLATADTDLRVIPFHGDPETLRAERQYPAVIWVVLTDAVARAEPRYDQKWGWERGVPHAVVVLGFTGEGHVIIGEPAVGPELWNIEALQDLWTGRALRLERREN